MPFSFRMSKQKIQPLFLTAVLIFHGSFAFAVNCPSCNRELNAELPYCQHCQDKFIREVRGLVSLLLSAFSQWVEQQRSLPALTPAATLRLERYELFLRSLADISRDSTYLAATRSCRSAYQVMAAERDDDFSLLSPEGSERNHVLLSEDELLSLLQLVAPVVSAVTLVNEINYGRILTAAMFARLWSTVTSSNDPRLRVGIQREIARTVAEYLYILILDFRSSQLNAMNDPDMFFLCHLQSVLGRFSRIEADQVANMIDDTDSVCSSEDIITSTLTELVDAIDNAISIDCAQPYGNYRGNIEQYFRSYDDRYLYQLYFTASGRVIGTVVVFRHVSGSEGLNYVLINPLFSLISTVSSDQLQAAGEQHRSAVQRNQRRSLVSAIRGPFVPIASVPILGVFVLSSLNQVYTVVVERSFSVRHFMANLGLGVVAMYLLYKANSK